MTQMNLPWLAAPLARWAAPPRGHAWLLHGAAGDGALELALSLAQAWLCENRQPTGPCGACPACHLTQTALHPDLLVLVPEVHLAEQPALAAWRARGDAPDGKRKPSRDIKVDAVRQAIDWSHASASRGQGKVMLLFPADAMNAVASNALLKTLEEPPPGVRLLLVTDDPERLLPTLRSRCQRWRLEGPDAAAATAWLHAQGVAEPEVLLAAAGGLPLTAQALAAGGLDAAAWRALPRQVAQGGGLPDLPPAQWVAVLLKLCHDAMAVAADAPPRYFPQGSIPERHNLARLDAWRGALLAVAAHAEHPWHAPLLTERLLAQAQAALRAK